MMRKLLTAGLLWAGTAWAQTATVPDLQGKLTLTTAALTSAASSQLAINADGYPAYSMVVQYTMTGTSATVQTDISCDGGTTWLPVVGSSVAITASVPGGVGVTAPQCLYRCTVTACTACNVLCKADMGVKVR